MYVSNRAIAAQDESGACAEKPHADSIQCSVKL